MSFVPVFLSSNRTVIAHEFWRDVPGRWHSQHGQDKTVADISRRMCWSSPYFIDLAANHPVEISNTRTLERDFHWRGICIEANQRYVRLLAGSRNCTVLGAATSKDSREQLFEDKLSNSLFSTSLPPHSHSFKVTTSTFSDIINYVSPPRVIN
jgi:hypothetical protein